MFDTADRLEQLEEYIGKPKRGICGFYSLAEYDVHERLDRLEDFMYAMKDWKTRVEGQLGLEEITNGRGEKEFLSTEVQEIRGYVRERSNNE